MASQAAPAAAPARPPAPPAAPRSRAAASPPHPAAPPPRPGPSPRHGKGTLHRQPPLVHRDARWRSAASAQRARLVPGQLSHRGGGGATAARIRGHGTGEGAVKPRRGRPRKAPWISRRWRGGRAGWVRWSAACVSVRVLRRPRRASEGGQGGSARRIAWAWARARDIWARGEGEVWGGVAASGEEEEEETETRRWGWVGPTVGWKLDGRG